MNFWLLLLALFVMAHGLIHLLYAIPEPKAAVGWPFQVEHSRTLAMVGVERSARPVGLLLGIVSAVGFLMAGLGLLGIPLFSQGWQLFMLIGAAASVLLLILFWNRTLILGLVIDAALLVALLWNQSPLASLVPS